MKYNNTSVKYSYLLQIPSAVWFEINNNTNPNKRLNKFYLSHINLTGAINWGHNGHGNKGNEAVRHSTLISQIGGSRIRCSLVSYQMINLTKIPKQ